MTVKAPCECDGDSSTLWDRTSVCVGDKHAVKLLNCVCVRCQHGSIIWHKVNTRQKPLTISDTVV